MDAEHLARIKDLHRASIMWRNGSVGYVCTCGGAWPCQVRQRADAAGRARAAFERDFDEVSPGEFWSR